jgi:hypothetical protein
MVTVVLSYAAKSNKLKHILKARNRVSKPYARREERERDRESRERESKKRETERER